MADSGEKKKRGRKPKVKEPTVPKKRGRKPKNKYGVTNNTLVAHDLGTIILHLPINSNDIKNDFVDTELLKYTPEIKSPKPYDHNMSIQPYTTQLSSPYPFSENNNSLFSNEKPSNENISNNEKNNTNIPLIHKETEPEDENVQSNKCNLNDLYKNKNINSYDFLSSNVSKVYNSDYINNSVDNSDILCYWCIHSFTNKSVGLPISYKNNKFETFGTFCSPECACAYNFNSNNIYDDIWYRYTLLNLMCSQLYNVDNISIKSASSRYTLNIFGGPLTIEQFRNNNINYSMDYKILDPPLISLMYQINEINISPKMNSFIPIDTERIKNADNILKLKRNNSVEKKNTLELCMNLTYNK